MSLKSHLKCLLTLTGGIVDELDDLLQKTLNVEEAINAAFPEVADDELRAPRRVTRYTAARQRGEGRIIMLRYVVCTYYYYIEEKSSHMQPPVGVEPRRR
jgi:hypothetical protein